MGAEFQTTTLPGDTPKSAVESNFEDLQATDRYENGHL